MNRNIHALRRTSPKGQLFLGTCIFCGMENLGSEDMKIPCESPEHPGNPEAVMATCLMLQGVYEDSDSKD